MNNFKTSVDNSVVPVTNAFNDECDDRIELFIFLLLIDDLFLDE